MKAEDKEKKTEQRMRQPGLFQDAGIRAKAALLLLFDVLAVYVSSFFSLVIRYEMSFFKIDPVYVENGYRYLTVNIVCTVMVFYLFRLYTSLWKYASVQELCNIAFAVVISGILQYFGIHLMGMRMPRSYYVLYILLRHIPAQPHFF